MFNLIFVHENQVGVNEKLDSDAHQPLLVVVLVVVVVAIAVGVMMDNINIWTAISEF